MKTIQLTFPHSKLNKYEKIIKKFNRKAKKFGFSEVSMKIIETVYIPCKVYNIHGDGSSELIKTIDKKHVTVEVSGEFPKFNGWTPVARLDHTPSGENIVNLFPLFYNKSIPEEFKKRQACDHCNINRYRKSTILIVDDYGNYKQVGTNCIADYIGSGDIENYINAEIITSDYFSPVTEIDSDEYNEHIKQGLYSEYGIKTVDFLAECVAMVRKYGYQSTKVDEDSIDNHLQSTRTQAEINFFALYGKLEQTDEDKEKAKRIIEWLKTDIEPTNEYMSNLKVLAGLEFASVKHLGYIASMTITYDKHFNSNKVNESEWIGSIGKKIETEVQLIFKKEFTNTWGWTLMNLMEDKDGNQFVWWTQNDSLTTEKTFKIRAKVKDHREYNGKKQTVITRVKVLN